MADWFKLQENWFVEPRLQWAIREQQSVVTVWLWCLTECCRIGSDTIGLHQEDFEMIGIQQLLNLSPGVFVSGINLLEKIKYVEADRTKNSLKVVKWTEFQSEYLSRKNRGDFQVKPKKRTKTPKVSVNIGDSPTEESRVEEIREEKKEEALSVPINLSSHSEFQIVWKRWMEFRMTKKKSNNFNALFQSQLDLMSDWGADGAIQSMKSSMANDYQGIFDPKNKGFKPNSKPSSKPMSRAQIEAQYGK